MEWANIKYQFTPDFNVRVGRTVLPAFLFADIRKLGYAHPWLRPPTEIYSLSALSSSDGVDTSYRLHVGELTDTIQLSFGNNETKLTGNNGVSDARSIWSISNTIEYGPLTTRITYQSADVTATALNALFGAFRQFGPQGVAIADRYNADKHTSVLGIGASYDPGDWFVTSEWLQMKTHSIVGKRTSWYVSSGFRFGEFTPYAMYARAQADNLSDPGLTLSALPAFLAGPATRLNAGLNSGLSRKPVQGTVSLGARWDFMKNVDLKLQVDHTRIGAGSTGVLINFQPDFQLGGKVNLFSAAVDFVF